MAQLQPRGSLVDFQNGRQVVAREETGKAKDLQEEKHLIPQAWKLGLCLEAEEMVLRRGRTWSEFLSWDHSLACG